MNVHSLSFIITGFLGNYLVSNGDIYDQGEETEPH